MIQFIKTGILLFIFTALQWNCAKKADIPAYIVIDSMVLLTNPATEGSAWQNLNEAWVYADNNLQGVYQTPLRFPVIGMGSRNFSFAAGVMSNGQIDNHITYPFYTTFDTAFTLVAEKEYHIVPKFKYRSSVKFLWLEDFESPNFSLVKTSDNSTDTLQRTSDINKIPEPGYCGRAVLKKKDEIFSWASRETFTLPGEGVETFVEINYKTELPIEIGFYQNYSTGVQRYPIVVPYSTSTWKKMYIKITDEVTTQLLKYGTSKFSIYIRAINDTDSDKEILIDNLKLLHF